MKFHSLNWINKVKKFPKIFTLFYFTLGGEVWVKQDKISNNSTLQTFQTPQGNSYELRLQLIHNPAYKYLKLFFVLYSPRNFWTSVFDKLINN